MSSASTSLPVEPEVERIRELSKAGRYREAAVAGQALAAAEPQNRDALYLTASNLRCLGRVPEALAALQRLEECHSRFSLLYQERGYCYMTLRDAPRAIDAFARAVKLNPALAASWTMLERLYRSTGAADAAVAASTQVALLNGLPREVVMAGSLFSDGGLAAAENILRAYLAKVGEHAEAMRLLARIEQERDALDEAEPLLKAAMKLAPDYRALRLDFVRVLLERQKYLQALQESAALLGLEPENRDYLSIQAAAHAGLGDHEQAIALYRSMLVGAPETSELHVLLGHALKAVGRQKQAVESYQTAAALRPTFGDPYWSLANLKVYRFSDDEIARMRIEEAAPASELVDRIHLCFALGKALEDRYEYADSWRFYERGNALRRAAARYHPEIVELNTRRQIEVCTAQFFATLEGAGAPDPDPIFIVGLPRSGSTLIEQVLASHSLVEGTQELSEIQRIVLDMRSGYPDLLVDFTPGDWRALGERYLAGARAYRKGKPYFIDKMPNNFRHIGLIHRMLPNAKIIDVRREPMSCCLSNLKQLFARGQEFTYSAEDIARYYRTYLELMRHWDAVLPGRVLRVWYEDVVDDLQGNVPRILEFCGLDFEPLCLQFYRTERSVRTASSEQVRQPIFREGLTQWHNYEPWLGPLKHALGDAGIRYRE